ncbi:MAG: hypothetical protein EHM42_00465 [Planctomycetaceae bacterium]|nr:MAG: hypothetical protein EHM42_00465 [Planctomycetaceae bacterium]
MTTSAAARATYRETFDDGPGGWFGFAGNHLGIAPLLIRDSCAVSRSPWWIDYNHAPPGAGYMHLLYMLHTRGAPGEYLREIAGPNRFIAGGFGTNFTNARITLRLRGELLTRGTQLYFLAQGVHDGVCSGWLLTGQPISVTADWTEQTITCLPDPQQWTCLGSRHDRVDFYGVHPLEQVLGDANIDILLVLFPLDIAPLGPLTGDPHRLRPERDYPVWRSRLPEGYVELDAITIDFTDQAS